MKRFVLLFCLTLLVLQIRSQVACAVESEFEIFLDRFDYEVRDDMKIDSKGLVTLLENDKAVLVDVRFKEEVSAWRISFAINIPLNELPKRINDLPKNKIIIAACPHKDRSAIAMAYLRGKGYDAKYLTDGLIGLAELLRGERAKDFMESLEKTKMNNAEKAHHQKEKTL